MSRGLPASREEQIKKPQRSEGPTGVEKQPGLERQTGFGHMETAREGRAGRERDLHGQRRGGGKSGRRPEEKVTSQVWLKKGPRKEGLEGPGLSSTLFCCQWGSPCQFQRLRSKRIGARI